MEYYSVLKRNELSNHEKTWGSLRCLVLSVRSQSEKAKQYCMIPTIRHYGKEKTMGTVKRSQLLGTGEWEGSIDGTQRIFRAVKLLCMILWW